MLRSSIAASRQGGIRARPAAQAGATQPQLSRPASNIFASSYAAITLRFSANIATDSLEGPSNQSIENLAMAGIKTIIGLSFVRLLRCIRSNNLALTAER